MDQDIMRTLSGHTNCILTNEKDLKSRRPKSFTALISNIDKVHNLFPGSVLYYGTFEGSGTVNIAVSNHEIVRYLYLSEINNWPGSNLEEGALIGTAGRRHTLGFEYCTQWRGDSKYPVRVLNRTYYKQNPIDLLDGAYIPPKESNVMYGINRPNDLVSLTQEQKKEWSNPFINNDLEIDKRLEAARYNPYAD